MPFQCPECTRSRTLEITDLIELPRDSRSDEITLQIVRCSGCGFEGIAVYEESRRGGFDDESVDHRGWHVRAADLRRLRETIRRCPKPRNPRCSCAAHRALGKKDGSGRWRGLADVELGKMYWVRL
jgi:hypothetical protein